MFTENGKLAELAKKEPDMRFAYEKTIVLGNLWYGIDLILLNANIQKQVKEAIDYAKSINIKNYIILLYDIIETKIFDFKINDVTLRKNVIMIGYIETHNTEFDNMLYNINEEIFIHSYTKIDKTISEVKINFIAIQYKNNNMPTCLQMMVV